MAADQNRDFPIAPDSYLYLQNIGSGGVISVRRGPTVVTQSGQDLPVRYDHNSRTFRPCSIEQAVTVFQRAAEGDYVIVENPSKGGDGKQFPGETAQNAIELDKGRKLVIPGPWSQALWPGQIATVIEGHRLRSNQYLIAIVYNSEQAEQNWEKGTVAKAQTESVEGETGTETKRDAITKKGLPKPESLAVGTRIIIKGTDVSFYIPCTGVEVLRDEETGKYVRDAVTLEQMEYCCLVDESGKKEYPKGPKVVFPRPTQVFEKDSKGRRKFRPIELNTINGLHLKVTADFEAEDMEKPVGADGKRPNRKYKEGEELFVTGKTLAIYYPREELAIIEYGQGNKKHYSTAIPKGEGRYLINRETGDIKLVRGPKMLLPDPRNEILVRRILSTDECSLMYPGNTEAAAYNVELAAAMAESPSGRSGLVSEGDWRKRQAKAIRFRGGGGVASAGLMADTDMALEAFGGPEQFEREEVGSEGGATGSLQRGTKYTEPRQLTLNTKYDGAIKVEVWPGYAVLVVGSEGSRRVVEGPEVILLEYDEKLGQMKLSTGKPKNSDKLLTTAYLCVQNNQVGDIIGFESKDHVTGFVKISMRVNFESASEEDKLRWFAVDNYVKYLCDHVRSIIAGMAKRHPIAEIKGNYVDLVRSAILGEKPSATDASEPLHPRRPGLLFDNGMRVIEVEVLELKLVDAQIAQLLDNAQHEVVKSNIQLEQQRKQLEVVREQEEINQAKLQAQHDTEQTKLALQKELIGDQLALALAQVEAELKKIEVQKVQVAQKEALTSISTTAQLERMAAQEKQTLEFKKAHQDLELAELDAGTKAAVERFQAAKDGLYEVLTLLGRDEMAAKLAEACTIERWLSGDSVSSSIGNLLSIAPSLKAFFDKAESITNRLGNGSSRLTQTAKS